MSGTRLYTKRQIFWGTLLGGPLAAVFFLKKNFDELRDEEGARKTLLYGGLLTLALCVMIPFLPEHFPSILFAVILAIIAPQLAEKYQFRLLTPRTYNDKFYSLWNVAGAVILSSIAFIGFFLLVYLTMHAFGIAPELPEYELPEYESAVPDAVIE